MKFFIVALLGLAALAQAKEIGIRNYDGYQVLSAVATTKSQFEVLVQLLQKDELDFWTSPRINGKTDIMANPDQIEQLAFVLKQTGMAYSVKIADVGKNIAEARIENDKLRTAAGGRMSWTTYERYAVIEEWIQSLDAIDIATVSTIGQSSEGRNLYMVKVSTGAGPGGNPKPAIFLDSNLHAREWISGAVGTWILNELTSKNPEYDSFLEAFDFYTVPMANPDGYEYSHTTDRLWRKTRSVNAGSTCRGCDPNRNFGFHFGGESTSSSPCSDIFKGEEAFSEPETQAIRDALKAIQASTELYAYITLHSYGQLWLLSWGYTQGEYPADYDELYEWGGLSTDALADVSGTQYVYGQGADMLYGVGGASDDYAKSEGAKWVATIELRDEGRYGFELPANQILPTAEETMAALRVLENPLGSIKRKITKL
jgi:carboxypeptidase A4